MRRIIKLPVFYMCLLPGAVLLFYVGSGRDTVIDKLQMSGNSKLPSIRENVKLKDYESSDETLLETPAVDRPDQTPSRNKPTFLKPIKDTPDSTPEKASHDTPEGVNDSTDDVTASPDDPSPSTPPPQPGKGKEEEGEEKKGKKRLKNILVWNNGYGFKTMGFGEGQEPFVDAGCEVDACYVTADRSHLPVSDYDAIIFHLRPTTPEELPRKRSPHQRWILWEIESASYVYQDIAHYAGLFNWTMTYRLDSDIPYRYGRVIPIKPSSASSSSSSSSRNYAAGKSKLGAWFVSNCLTHSRREKIVQFMRDLDFPVDVYGKCGKMKCPRDEEGRCYTLLDKHYKFYMSFENSLCLDYVTEKLFSVLKHDVVPVVFGLANYTAVAPPHSFINVLDFSSIKDLVDHLKYLDTHDEEYNKYFKWKGHYRIVDGWQSTKEGFCALCKKLHEDNTPKIYKDLKQWFVSQGKCKRVHGMPLHALRNMNPLLEKFDILLRDKSFEEFLQVKTEH